MLAEIGLRSWLLVPGMWLFLELVGLATHRKVIGFELSPKCRWLFVDEEREQRDEKSVDVGIIHVNYDKRETTIYNKDNEVVVSDRGNR